MKRAEIERVEELVGLWLSYIDKTEKYDAIAKEGESIQGKISDFHGDLPQSGLFKPETIGKRVDRCAKIVITSDEKHAHGLVMELPVLSRLCVTVWPQIKRKRKPGGNDRYTKSDLLLLIGLLCGEKLSCETYLEERRKAMKYLIARDALKTQHLVVKKLN